MTVDDAVDFFAAIPKIARKVQTIKDVGLGYVTLGQPATTLSGGEAQRMKLASELHKRSTGKSFYILDEPTTGLHTDDIARLLKGVAAFCGRWEHCSRNRAQSGCYKDSRPYH